MPSVNLQNIDFQDPILLGTIIILIILVILTVWIARLERRMQSLTRGKGGESLEEAINAIAKRCEDLSSFRAELEQYLESLEERVRKSARHIETIRFNPFQGNGTGGNQSFSTAFLDEKGNGVILTGLHSRETMRVFAKPITNHASDYELTGEEKRILENARSSAVQSVK
jgi:hypothetical protein